MKRLTLAGSLLVAVPLFVTTTGGESRQEPVVQHPVASFTVPTTTTVTTTIAWHRPHCTYRCHKDHRRRHRPDPPPMQTATASWYDLWGIGACGVPAQSGLAFANLSLPCGATVEFCYDGCAKATMDDRGPYVYSRLFDLNINLRNAIGCPDLCAVRWRRLS